MTKFNWNRTTSNFKANREHKEKLKAEQDDTDSTIKYANRSSLHRNKKISMPTLPPFKEDE